MQRERSLNASALTHDFIGAIARLAAVYAPCKCVSSESWQLAVGSRERELDSSSHQE